MSVPNNKKAVLDKGDKIYQPGISVDCVILGFHENELKLLLEKYTKEVDRLNQIIVQEIVPKIVSQIQQYLDYLRDASQQPYYMDKPKNESVKGQKQYRSITQVLAGGQF